MASVSGRTFAEVGMLNRFSNLKAWEESREPITPADFYPSARGFRGFGDDTVDAGYPIDGGDPTYDPSTLDTITAIIGAATPAVVGITGALTHAGSTYAYPGGVTGANAQPITQPYRPGGTAPASSNTMLYVGLGVAAVAALFLMKK